jgi:small nuclear ribonucleoprotein (snRNP)-like protein
MISIDVIYSLVDKNVAIVFTSGRLLEGKLQREANVYCIVDRDKKVFINLNAIQYIYKN